MLISPFYWVLANSDSLLLSPDQVIAVNAAAERRQAYIDSTYRELAADLATLPKDVDIDAVVKRVSNQAKPAKP